MTETKDLTPVITKLDWKVVPRDTQMPLPLTFVSEKQPAPLAYARSSQTFGYYPGRVAKTVPAKKDLPGDVNQLLSDTADYFEKGASWCQHSLGNDDQVCMVGGMLRMETGDSDNVYNSTQPFRHPLTSSAVEKISKHLDVKGIRVRRRINYSEDPNFVKVSNWNDTEGRTKEEVIELLKAAAKD